MTIAKARSVAEHAAALSDLLADRGISPDSISSYSLSFHGPHSATAMIHLSLSPDDIPGEYWVRDEGCDYYSAAREEHGVELTLFASD